MAIESIAPTDDQAALPDRQFTLYSKPEYYADLTERIAQTEAGDRVALQTMAFDPTKPAVQQLMHSLGEAAVRKVECSLAVDARIFLVGDKKELGPALFYGKYRPLHLAEQFRRKREALDELQKQGVRCVVTNQPRRPLTNPHAGRSHIKLAVVNDCVYVGGCNLTGAKEFDMMVGWDDQRTADWLYNLEQNIVGHKSTKLALHGEDLTFPVDKRSELLIDSGKRGQSIIFEKALELINQAEKEVFMTCQYFPNSITTQHLLRAQERGAKITLLYNHPNKHGVQQPLHHAVMWRERQRLPADFFADQLPQTGRYLHAKLIATEKGAIIGSHNYIRAGVNFGTAEIALLSHDPAFAKQAKRTITEQL